MKFLKNINDNFLFFIILVFVFISTSALAISKIIDFQNINNNSSQEADGVLSYQIESETFTPLPVLRDISTFPVISSQAALVIDLDSSVILYEKDPDKKLLPASTTKIITALVALDYYTPEQTLVVDGIKINGQKMRLLQGEKIKTIDLLYGLLIGSANDAAEVLADSYPGGREGFIEDMNNKVGELGLKNTYFINPSGLDAEGHQSTARDLIRVASYAMENPLFAKIVATETKVVTSTDGRIIHKLKNINELVGTVDGVLGVKTGWTENARENLVTYIERDGKRLMIAVLGSQDRFGETKELINWIFENYEWKIVTYPQN